MELHHLKLERILFDLIMVKMLPQKLLMSWQNLQQNPASPSEKILVDVFIPDWIRNDARGWAENQITDDDFATGIEFLIKEKIILIPNLIHIGSSEAQFLIGLKIPQVGGQMV